MTRPDTPLGAAHAGGLLRGDRLQRMATRTRRNHGVFLLGSELASVYSLRRQDEPMAVHMTIGSGSLQLSCGMTSAQARVMAQALNAAAAAIEQRHTVAATSAAIEQGAAAFVTLLQRLDDVPEVLLDGAQLGEDDSTEHGLCEAERLVQEALIAAGISGAEGPRGAGFVRALTWYLVKSGEGADYRLTAPAVHILEDFAAASRGTPIAREVHHG